MTRLFAGLLVALSALLSVSAAQAQRAWLLPSSSVVDYKEPWVSVDAATSEHLFNADRAPLKLETLEITGPSGQRVAPANLFSGKLRSGFDIALDRQGTYKASVVLRTVAVSYKLDGVAQRWRGPEEAMAKAVPAQAQEVVVSRLQQRVETFVSMGAPDRAALTASGEGLELVPVTHPNDLRSGETVIWRLLVDGKAAVNLPFSLIPGGVRYRGVLGEQRYTTDGQGEVSLLAPVAGMYLLSATWPAAVGGAAGMPSVMPARRLAYTATLEVLPP